MNVPVYLPKVYNGRDKTFFLFSYERRRHGERDAERFLLESEPRVELQGVDYVGDITQFE